MSDQLGRPGGGPLYGGGHNLWFPNFALNNAIIAINCLLEKNFQIHDYNYKILFKENIRGGGKWTRFSIFEIFSKEELLFSGEAEEIFRWLKKNHHLFHWVVQSIIQVGLEKQLLYEEKYKTVPNTEKIATIKEIMAIKDTEPDSQALL